MPPAGGFVENDYPYSAQVLVQNTTAVTITNLVIDGENGDCPQLRRRFRKCFA